MKNEKNAKQWQDLRERGFRILLVGLFSLILAFIIYSRFSVPSSDPLAIEYQKLMGIAYGILLITAIGIASMIYGSLTILNSERIRTCGNSNSLIYRITSPFSRKDYCKILVVSAIGYGVFFGFLSQIFVYRSDVSFADKGIRVPSLDLVPCCGAPGYMPMLTVYITNHFLILIIPINIILATIVSVLVGFNVALSVYAYRTRKSLRASTSIAGGVGATCGLFVGCPTCAGSILSALLGVGIAGAGTSASVLAPFQTLFIAASIPSLVIAPFLIARSLKSISGFRFT
jgi:hypothetical protein